MSTLMYVDAEYVSSAAFYWGSSHGLTRAKVDYRSLIEQFTPTLARAYVAPPSPDKFIAFTKFLGKCGFAVQRLAPENKSAAITSQMSIDANADYLGMKPDRVVIVSGNGSLAPLCRVLHEHCELILLAFPDSVSNSLLSIGADTDCLRSMVYDTATRP